MNDIDRDDVPVPEAPFGRTRLELLREVDALREVFCAHARVRAVHADMTTLHNRDNRGSEGGVLTLFGESRSGKTRILRSYARRFPTVEKARPGPMGEFADLKEVVMIRVPDTSVKNLLERLLAELTNVTTAKVKGAGARRFDIQEDIFAVAKTVGLKLLLLEEAHQAIDNKNASVARTLAGVLKDLTNESRFSLVIAGTLETRRLIDASPELEGRVLYEHELTPLRWEEASERELFLEVMESLDDHLTENVFGRPSGLTGWVMAKPLLDAACGHIGHAAKLLEVAAKSAVDDMATGNGRTLTLDHLAYAFGCSPLRRRYEGDAAGLFPRTRTNLNAAGPDNPVTRLRGRTRVTGRDDAFKR